MVEMRTIIVSKCVKNIGIVYLFYVRLVVFILSRFIFLLSCFCLSFPPLCLFFAAYVGDDRRNSSYWTPFLCSSFCFTLCVFGSISWPSFPFFYATTAVRLLLFSFCSFLNHLETSLATFVHRGVCDDCV